METNEVKYFIQTAQTKNLRKAAEIMAVSPSAVSKAIGRLEQELETKLIERVGRNLALTKAGHFFAKQGAEFLALERQIVMNHNKNYSDLEIKIVGPELPLSQWGHLITKKIIKTNPSAQIKFKTTTNQRGLDLVNSYQADFALFTVEKKIKKDQNLIKNLGTFSFKIFSSKNHHLAKKNKIEIIDILNEKFALTNSNALSLFNKKTQTDGWPINNKFNRKKLLLTDSLKALDSVLLNGLAISYLPDFYGQNLGLKEINIKGFPYKKTLSVYLCRNKYGLNNIWSSL